MEAPAARSVGGGAEAEGPHQVLPWTKLPGVFPLALPSWGDASTLPVTPNGTKQSRKSPLRVPVTCQHPQFFCKSSTVVMGAVSSQVHLANDGHRGWGDGGRAEGDGDGDADADDCRCFW